MRMLEPSPTADRRLKALIPTEAFLALHRERWRKALETLAPIEPRARDVARVLEERRALAAFAATIAGRFERGFRVMALAPALGPAAEHASGLMILLAILADGGPEPGERRLVITGLARRFLVSRGHVLEVLRTAEASGLLAIAGETGAGVTLRPAFRDAFGDFFAGMFAVLLAASANALAAAEARREAGVSRIGRDAGLGREAVAGVETGEVARSAVGPCRSPRSPGSAACAAPAARGCSSRCSRSAPGRPSGP